MFIQSLLLISSFAISASQELRNGYLNPINSTYEVNLDNSETRQTDLWLLSRNGPVPVELNRGWSPETGYPGVQTVTSLHRGAYGYRLRGSQSPIGVVHDRSDQPRVAADDVIVLPPETSNVPNLERSFLNIQDPESVLVELPVELSSGFWERPRPQIIQELSASGRRLNSVDDPSSLQFDGSSAGNTEQDNPINVFVPNREADSRLPLSISPQESDIPSTREVPYEIPNQTYDPSSASLNNQSLNVPPTTREDIWFPVHGRTASVSPTDLSGNGDKLLYHISFEEPSQTPSQDNIGLTLTPDDIDILERLGILSSLSLEGFESSNNSETSSVENSQREYENAPQLIDHVGQSYNSVPESRFGTNLSDIVFIEIPEFTTSQYHGNLPGNDGVENVRPIPYVISDTVKTPEGNSNDTYLNSPVFNGTSLTSEQIQEILQFLGLYNFGSTNEIPIEQVKSNTTKETIFPHPDLVAQDVITSLPIANTSAVYNTHSNVSYVALTSEDSFRERKENPVSVNQEDTNTTSQGLVSSGRIQPRILESEGFEKDNEVLQMLSRRVSPVSAQKLEMLQKLNKPKPYVFGYMQNDGNGTVQHRDETADGSGSIKGTYGYRDSFGVYRNVSYIADDNGFHAVVRTNEPGTISHNPADAVIMSELPPKAAIAQMMAYIKRNSSFSSNT